MASWQFLAQKRALRCEQTRRPIDAVTSAALTAPLRLTDPRRNSKYQHH